MFLYLNIQKKKHKKLKCRRTFNFGKVIFILLLLIVLILFVKIYYKGYIPVMEQAAKYRGECLLTDALNDGITKVFGKEDSLYEKLTEISKDMNGNVTSLKSDLSYANKLKSDLISYVNNSINSQGKIELAVPAGNFIYGELFAGTGPYVKCTLTPCGSTRAEFINDFTSSGINQTRHRIIIRVKGRISFLVPGCSCAAEISEDIPIAESIITGLVPDNLTQLDTDIQSLKDYLLNIK